VKRLIVLLVLAIVATACGSNASDELTTTTASSTSGTGASGTTSPTATTEPPMDRTPSGTLTIAHGIDIDRMDPQTQATAAVMGILSMMVETLVSLTPEGTIEPLLATSWEASDDGKVYTFELRDGVTFSDGEPFNAAAVEFSLERLVSPDTVNAAPNVLAVIDSVDVIDDLTVAVNLNNPFPPFISAITLPLAAITSPAAATVAPNTPEQIVQPVGTGPYVFEELVPGDHISMTANLDYWGALPAYEQQIFLAVPEASSRVALLRSGGADVIVNPPAVELSVLRDDPDINVINADSAYVTQIVVNNATVSDPTIRRALNYAVDREQIIDAVLFGAGSGLDAPIPSFIAGHCATDDWFEYDPDRAKELLAEAGASNLSLKMVSPEGRYFQDYAVAEAVAGMFRAVGLNVELANPLDFPTYLSEVMVPPAEATSDLRLLGWGTLYNEASQALLQFQSDQHPPNGFNATYSDIPGYDALVAEASSIVDDADRFATYCEALNLLVEYAPTVWLYSESLPIVTSDQVTGVYGLSNLMYITTWAEPTS